MLKTPQNPYFSRVRTKILPVDFLLKIKGRNVENNCTLLRKPAKWHIIGKKSKILPFWRFLTFPQNLVDWKTPSWKLGFCGFLFQNQCLSTVQNEFLNNWEKSIKSILPAFFITHFPPPFPHRAKPCGKPVDNLLFSRFLKKAWQKLLARLRHSRNKILYNFLVHTTT